MSNEGSKKMQATMSGHLDFKENRERVLLQERVPSKERQQQAELSFTTWKRINAGYYDSPPAKSTMHSSFQYNEKKVDETDKTHNRKADKFTNYVEARERYKLLTSSNKPQKGNSS
jgi:hypothetical protein